MSTVGIDLAGGRRVGLAIGAERHELAGVLDRVHGGVVLGRAGAVDAAEDPDHVGRRLVLLHARRQRAAPARAGERIGLRAGARRPRARHLEHVRPGIQHREQEIAALHVWQAEDPGLPRQVEPGGGVERVGVRRGHVPEGGIRVAPRLDEMPHRGAGADGCGDVGHDPAGHLHRDQRIDVGVGLDGRDEILEPFERPDHRSVPVGARRRQAGGCEQRQAAGDGLSSGHWHDAVPVVAGAGKAAHYATGASRVWPEPLSIFGVPDARRRTPAMVRVAVFGQPWHSMREETDGPATVSRHFRRLARMGF